MPVETDTHVLAGHPGSSRAEGEERGAGRQDAAQPLRGRGSVREPPAVQVRGAGPPRGDARGRPGSGAAVGALSRGPARTPRQGSRGLRSTRASGGARATSTGATSRSSGRNAVPRRLCARVEPCHRRSVSAATRSSRSGSARTSSLARTSPCSGPSSTRRWRGRSCARHTVRALRTSSLSYRDLHVRRAAIELGPEEELGWAPPHELEQLRSFADTHPAVISLAGDPEPELLADLDSALVGRAESKELRTAWSRLVAERAVNWTILAAPNEGWARAVLRRARRRALVGRRRDRDPARRGRPGRRLGRARRPAADPRRTARAQRVRRDPLSRAGHRSHRWAQSGGLAGCALRSRRRQGIDHIPNLPTEEVFTSPDWRRADGVVRSTYPLVVGGLTVTDLELRFDRRSDRRTSRPRRGRA